MIQKIRSFITKLAYSRVLPSVGGVQKKISAPVFEGDELSVYWLGHSMMNHTVKTENGELNLFVLMRRFAQEQQLNYRDFDHTLFGAPLSMHWWGSPHSYARVSPPEMDEKRNDFDDNAEKHNTFVLTEVVPLAGVFRVEFSAYYLRQFYYRIKKYSPNSRVYVYESWDYLHGDRATLPNQDFNWSEQMKAQRTLWEKMIDLVEAGCVVPPNIYFQLKMILGLEKPRPDDQVHIFLVPVGQVLLELKKRLENPLPEDDFSLANGESLKFYELFINAYTNWPNENDQLILNHPEQELDDIHPSAYCMYIVALTHFATLYQKSPEGLAPLEGMSEGLARTLQKMVWEVVSNDPRSGV